MSLASLCTSPRVRALVCAELSGMLGMTVTAGPAQGEQTDAKYVAVIPLMFAPQNAEVAIAVSVDEQSGAALAETIFGCASVEPAILHDIVRELANLAAGAFKRGATDEGWVFTIGFPTDTTQEHRRARGAAVSRRWTCTVRGADITLELDVELRIGTRRPVELAALREGMVVATDLHDQRGVLVLRSGTLVSEHQLDRIRHSLDKDAFIEILDVA